MPTPHVSLQEVLSALGGPLEERALWALLRQGASTLAREIRGEIASYNSRGNGARLGEQNYVRFSPRAATEVPCLLISPESMLLYHGGVVQFLQGLPGITRRACSCVLWNSLLSVVMIMCFHLHCRQLQLHGARAVCWQAGDRKGCCGEGKIS